MWLHEKQKCARQAFTLVELTAVVGITAILASLLLLGVSAARESARKVQCSNNLKQIGLALHNYESNHKVLPRGVNANEAGPLVAILPFVDQNAIYDQIDFGAPMSSNSLLHKTKIPLFRCPSTLAQDRARTDYGLNRGSTLAKIRNGPWSYEEKKYPTFSDFSRGSSMTALMAEICPSVSGAKPGAILPLGFHAMDSENDSRRFTEACERFQGAARVGGIDNGHYWFGMGTTNYFHLLPPLGHSCDNDNSIQRSLFSTDSMHSTGCNLLFADAHVDFVASSTNREVWQELGKR